ncbi:MAG: hypothetical protein ABJJ71_17550, partial [Lentilitoribacter sp.]
MTVPSWVAQQPSAFDIVACYFPEKDVTDGGEIFKLRPALVLKVLKGKNTGSIACEVAYGTKNLKFVQRKNRDVIIQNAADLTIIGLA